MKADLARIAFSVNGNGLLIGVLSDSYNCKGGAAADIASGDLPSAANSIVIVLDLTTAECTLLKGQDEGRAMMQVIHDVAPGARLAFRTAVRGEADFAVGISELAAAGCDIIVDDVINEAEPMFQDGVIAQAANQVVTQGIPYFSAAGNQARRSWDAPTGYIPVNSPVGGVHLFGTDSSGNPITRMRITVPQIGNHRSFVFQWDQPFKSVTGSVGPQTDLDINLFLNGTPVAQSLNTNISGGAPLEVFNVAVSGPAGSSITYEFEIRNFSGPNPTYMKLVVFGGDVTFQYPTNLGTSYGHSNAALVAGVGAADFVNTPEFGVSPPVIEFYSSVGGIPIFLAKDGSRLSSPEIRNQPRFIGPDNVANTFFGQQDSGGTWRIKGTSAAAPHVAAVAALMLQFRGGRRSLTPSQIYSTLEATAVDMDDPFTSGFDLGFDFCTGYGLVNALEALQALVVRPTPVAPPVVPPTPVTPPVVPPTPVTPPVVPPTPVTPPVVPPTPVTPPVVPPTPVTPPVVDCTVTFDLFNALTDTKVATLTNGVTIVNPPPCGQTNIQAVVPCGDSDGKVTIELYQGTKKIRKATDSGIPYFLFGNNGSDVKKGKIKAGSYSIRAYVNGVWSSYTYFTLGGTCSKRAR